MHEDGLLLAGSSARTLMERKAQPNHQLLPQAWQAALVLGKPAVFLSSHSPNWSALPPPTSYTVLFSLI